MCEFVCVKHVCVNLFVRRSWHHGTRDLEAFTVYNGVVCACVSVADVFNAVCAMYGFVCSCALRGQIGSEMFLSVSFCVTV